MLEQGIIQGVKNALGGIFGVGAEGAAYVGKKIGNIGTGIEKAVASVKSAYATGKLGPASKAFNDLFSKTREAGEQLVGMHTAAGKTVPEKLKQFNTAAAALTAKEIKAEEAKNKPPAASTAAPTGGATTAAAPTGGATAATGTAASTTTGTPATGAAKAKPGIGESKPVAINKGATSLKSNLIKLAGDDAEKKTQITGVLAALGGDLKTGKIPINEASGLVDLKTTVKALQAITDPELFKSVKNEIVKILANIGTKVNIDQVKSARQAKPPAKPAATPPAATPPAATEESETNRYNESLRRKYRFGLISLNEYNIKRRR